MVALSNESLDKTSKQELISILLKFQNRWEYSNTQFAEEECRLNGSL